MDSWTSGPVEFVHATNFIVKFAPIGDLHVHILKFMFQCLCSATRTLVFTMCLLKLAPLVPNFSIIDGVFNISFLFT